MKFRTNANRLAAVVMAFVMVVSMVFAPALRASAEEACASAEFRMNQNGMDISVKAYIAQTVFALLGSLSSDGEVVADAGIYAGENGLAVTANPFLDQAYGVDLVNFAQNLAASVFAPNSGSALALDEETYNMLVGGGVPQMNISVDPAMIESVAPVVEKYAGMIVEGVMSAAKMTASTEVLPMGTSEIEASIIVLSVTGDSLGEIAKNILTEAAQDADLKAAAAQIFDAGMEAAAASGQDVSEMEGVTGEQLMEAVWEELPALAEQVPAVVTEAGFAASVSIGTDNATGALVCLSMEVEAQGDSITLSLATCDEVTMFEVYQGETSMLSVYYVTGENSDVAYVSQFSVSSQDQPVVTIDFTLDKQTDIYALVATAQGETVTVVGTIAETADTFVVTVDQVNDQEMGISLTLRANDSVSMPAYQEILTMSEDEIIQLIQTVQGVVESMTGAAA